MEHIAALLLIVGCSGDLKQCAELPAPTPIYETVEECGADLPLSLAAAKDKKERVFATCVDVDPAMEEEDAQLFWEVTPDGVLQGSVEAVTDALMALADGGSTLNQTR